MPSASRMREQHAILLRAVVVLAGADVAARAVEVDVQRFRHGLAANEPRDAGKVGAGHAGAVVALRMARVVAEHGERLVAVPERKQRHLRIDDSLRLGTQCRVFAWPCSAWRGRGRQVPGMRRFDATSFTSATPQP